MSVFTKTGNDVFAPVNADGSLRPIDNGDAQRWSTEVETLLRMAVLDGQVYAQRSDLYANLVPVANTPALVIGDPTAGYDGLYMKVGATTTGSWTQILDFVPGAQFVTATDAGAGTANAIQVTTNLAVGSDGTQLVAFHAYRVSTASPVTVAGLAPGTLTIKTAAGADVPAGAIVAGMPLVGRKSGATFRLISDLSSTPIQAAAEMAQAKAQEAQAAAEEAAWIAVAAASTGFRAFASWTALSAVTGTMAGQRADVRGDGGTHTDPVVGGTVDNEGVYSWSASPAGWQRLGDLADDSMVAEVTDARGSESSLGDRLDAMDVATQEVADDLSELTSRINTVNPAHTVQFPVHAGIVGIWDASMVRGEGPVQSVHALNDGNILWARDDPRYWPIKEGDWIRQDATKGQYFRNIMRVIGSSNNEAYTDDLGRMPELVAEHCPPSGGNGAPTGGYTITGMAMAPGGVLITGDDGRRMDGSVGVRNQRIVEMTPDKTRLYRETSIQPLIPSIGSIQVSPTTRRTTRSGLPIRTTS